jgi:hypothetical protein
MKVGDLLERLRVPYATADSKDAADEIERLREINVKLLKALEFMVAAFGSETTFEAGPDEYDDGVAVTKAIEAVLIEDDAIERARAVIAKAKGQQ